VKQVLCVAVLLCVALTGGVAFGAHAGSPIDGRWRAEMTRAGLLRTGEVDALHAGQLQGPWTAQFADGRFEVRNERTGGRGRGTFSVTGNVVRFVFASGVGIPPGTIAFCAESVYRDRLAFTKIPGRRCVAWNAAAWTRLP